MNMLTFYQALPNNQSHRFRHRLGDVDDETKETHTEKRGKFDYKVRR
jgi:hypothetical protein